MSTSFAEIYNTTNGSMWHGDAIEVLAGIDTGSVNLILTSPPFALTRKKEYGNHPEDEYVGWFEPFAEEFSRILADDGSLVIDLGGAWLPGSPTRSLYQYRLLINLHDKFGFHLAEDFYWFNRAKLPGPRQWATIERNRVKDAVNTIWWLSKSERPKADNRRVLKPYSPAMQRMIKRGTYNDGERPSQHKIGKKWAQDLGGAIPPNVIEVEDHPELYQEPDNMLDLANTNSTDPYHAFCRSNEIKRHPARFPRAVPEFFIKFLTDEGDLVVDPFGGSNVTGEVAEKLRRRWIACDLDIDYVKGSLGRFGGTDVKLTSTARKLGLSSSMIKDLQTSKAQPQGLF
ncbi:site-specific DNA-methyltransferase [Micromonospora aurantiaca]|uniref:DNA-methyltransferase n=1 Tax=Micromonospora TaxID=1873 RepID=UPI002417F92D|nr:site-specific DNA-methyltransferase [Micromonospora sp. WMMD718]MDG4754603.1 site-specific DNA-methyltransferase [Micromonospora sp. WMMD718]